MSSYQITTSGFTSRKKRGIERVLAKWARNSLGREIVRNINPLERFLPSSHMKPLLIVIYNGRNESLDELARLYERECFNHTRAGGPILCPKPKIVGRAAEKEALINYLYRKNRRYFRTKALARDFIQRLLTGDSMTTTEASILMAEYSAWVTWNEDPLGSDPFSFARSGNSADTVRACMGLDPQHRMKGEPILLLIYKTHFSIDLFRPTIADAGLHRFFEPAPIGLDAHGLTKTWPPGMGTKITALLPRPEAVHSRQSFKYLNLPLEELS